jgi:hypothetical protein
MPASSGRLSAIMSTGHEAELHSQARASWKCSRARSPRPRRSSSTPKAEGRMQGVSPNGPRLLTVAAQQVVSYLRYTGPQIDAFAAAAGCPTRSNRSRLPCRAQTLAGTWQEICESRSSRVQPHWPPQQHLPRRTRCHRFRLGGGMSSSYGSTSSTAASFTRISTPAQVTPRSMRDM